MAHVPEESAIPRHLTTTRTHPSGAPEGHVPSVPAYAARFPAEAKRLCCAYFGVQSESELSDTARTAVSEILETMSASNGPLGFDLADFVDAEGFATRLIIAYWSDGAHFELWWEQQRATVLGLGSPLIGHGRFAEITAPSLDRFESMFSSNDRPEAAARVAGSHMSCPIREHEYWGSMRDRIPLSQTDALTGDSSAPTANWTDDGTIVVVPTENTAIIRSGQDWTECGDAETAEYLRDVEPPLRAGMDFLESQGGEIGCYSNRYATIVSTDGQPTRRTFGYSYWNDLAAMEKWAASHPSHLAIFQAGIDFVSRPNGSKLRLYHEVYVVEASRQQFEYRACHPRTGMLAATVSPVRSAASVE